MPQVAQYAVGDPFWIFHNFRIPKANDTVTFGLQKLGSPPIVNVILQMRCSVNFNDQTFRAAREVADERPDHDLAVESEAAKPTCPQELPHFEFWLGRRVAQLPRPLCLTPSFLRM